MPSPLTLSGKRHVLGLSVRPSGRPAVNIYFT